MDVRRGESHNSIMSSIKKNILSRIFLALIFVLSGIIINAIQALLFISIRPYDVDLYRRINYYLIYTSWSQIVALSQWYSGMTYRLFYKNEDDLKNFGSEHTFVTLNHRYEIDWLVCWLISEKHKLLGSSKSFAKTSLKYVPVVGWSWFLSDFIFLKRNWDEDKLKMGEGLDQLFNYQDKILLLFFPEGTRFTEKKYETSMKYASDKGLQTYKYHLLPRIKGFAYTIRHMKKKHPNAHFYDLQLAFPDNEMPTFGDILEGKGFRADIFMRRIDIESIPSETDEDAAQFLYKLFNEKDQLMDYHKINSKFPGEMVQPKPRLISLINLIVWASIITFMEIKTILLILTCQNYIVMMIAVTLIIFAFLSVKLLIGSTKINKGSKYGTSIQNDKEKNIKKQN